MRSPNSEIIRVAVVTYLLNVALGFVIVIIRGLL